MKENLRDMDPESLNEIFKQYLLLRSEKLKEREHNEPDSVKRDAFQRDYSRILYSSSFRRLQGKMQIFGVDSAAFYRNRLTHSLEVAQIAVGIASSLGDACRASMKSAEEEWDEHQSEALSQMYKDDIFLIEAAALAHDIGHPAFGHSGERELNRLGTPYSLNFEGNAQNYRVLRTLEKKLPEKRGLNLTYRTLLAINKYIVEEKDGVNKFMYSDDFSCLDSIREKTGLKGQRTLDVQIIELADDIAYAVHDLEDGLARQKFSIDEILFEINKEDSADFDMLNAIVDKAKQYASQERTGNAQDYSKLLRMKITSELVHSFMVDVGLQKIDAEMAKTCGVSEGNYELSLIKLKNLLRKLKKTTFNCLTKDDEVKLYETRGAIVLQTLFRLFTNQDINKDGKLMPQEYRPWGGQTEKAGVVAKELVQHAMDFIAGMMDTYAIELFEKFTNVKFEEIDVEAAYRKCESTIREWCEKPQDTIILNMPMELFVMLSPSGPNREV